MRPEEKAARKLIRTSCHDCERHGVCDFGDTQCIAWMASVIARANAEHYLPLLKRACMELCGPRFGDCKVKNLSDCFLLEEIAALEAAQKEDV